MRIKRLFFIFVVIMLGLAEAKNSVNISSAQSDVRVVKMCNNPNWVPIEFAKDANMSNMQGIAIDTLRLLEDKLKIKFKNVPTKSWSQSQEFLRDRKCDILPAAIETDERKKYALFTAPYLVYKLVIITKNDKPFVDGINSLSGKTIARKKGSGLIDKIKNLHSGIKVVTTENYIDSFKKVSSGEAYCTVATLPVASYFINKFALNNLHISGYIGIKYKLSIAVRNDNQELFDTLSSGLGMIKDKEIKNIYSEWVEVKLVESLNYRYLLYAIALVLIIVLLLIYRQRLLQKSNKELEQEVKAKVEENLIQHQLLQEQSKLAAMGEMIGAIAHQWRQPLNALSLSIQNLEYDYEDGKIDEEFIEEYIEKNQTTIRFMSQTIDDFRTFFKTDKVKETFGVKKVIESVLSMQSVYFNKYGIETSVYGDDFRVYGLQSEFQQVVLNLVSNSKDALINNREAGREIRILLEDKAVIFIDNAGGIPAHILETIFDPYFTTKKSGTGTGLGLYMSRMIIEDNMKAKITAFNKDDGAVFLLDFKVINK